MDALEANLPKVECSEQMPVDVKCEVLEKVDDDAEVSSRGGQRENRLTSIIDHLRCQSKIKGKKLNHFLLYYIFGFVVSI